METFNIPKGHLEYQIKNPNNKKEEDLPSFVGSGWSVRKIGAREALSCCCDNYSFPGKDCAVLENN